MSNEKIKVIAISGFKGSGKDTIAEIIDGYARDKNEKLKNEEGAIVTIVKKFSMAKPIRDIVETAFSLPEPDYGKKEDKFL